MFYLSCRSCFYLTSFTRDFITPSVVVSILHAAKYTDSSRATIITDKIFLIFNVLKSSFMFHNLVPRAFSLSVGRGPGNEVVCFRSTFCSGGKYRIEQDNSDMGLLANNL